MGLSTAPTTMTIRLLLPSSIMVNAMGHRLERNILRHSPFVLDPHLRPCLQGMAISMTSHHHYPHVLVISRMESEDVTVLPARPDHLPGRRSREASAAGLTPTPKRIRVTRDPSLSIQCHQLPLPRRCLRNPPPCSRFPRISLPP